MKLLTGNSNKSLSKKISKYLKSKLINSSIRKFADGEIYIEINENIRGNSIFIIQSISSPANDNLMELLLCIDALKRSSAKNITTVIPYFGYARQDRKVVPRTSISAKLVSNLITKAGADRVVTVDLHAGQVQGFFDIPVDNLFCTPIFTRHIKKNIKNKNIICVAPDVGGTERARALGKSLNVGLAIVDKRRPAPGKSQVMNVIGNVKDKTCIIVDDIIDNIQKQKLSDFINKWIQDKINLVLKSLVDLKNIKDKNSSIKALAYQLYENNGVLKREQVSEYLKSLGQNERKILRELGVKFGRYHVFLYQLIKPEAVSLRTLLWKNFHQKYFNIKPPIFGLNFLDDKELRNKNFMLLCGFEKFDNLFVRIDILERLFMLIINSPNSKENKEIKIIPEMLNLLGCSKDNFKKLLQKMNYKIFDKNDETYFKYNPIKKFKQNSNKKVSSENPFKILKNLNLG